MEELEDEEGVDVGGAGGEEEDVVLDDGVEERRWVEGGKVDEGGSWRWVLEVEREEGGGWRRAVGVDVVEDEVTISPLLDVSHEW